MTVERINLGTETTKANELRSAIRNLLQAKQGVEHMVNVMDKCVDSEDYAYIATVFGCSEANAQVLYNLTVGAKTALSAYDVGSLIARVG